MLAAVCSRRTAFEGAKRGMGIVRMIQLKQEKDDVVDLEFDWVETEKGKEIVPGGKEKVCLWLHGLMGSSRGWTNFLHRLQRKEGITSRWKFLVPDLRFHHRTWKTQQQKLKEKEKQPFASSSSESNPTSQDEETLESMQPLVTDLVSLCHSLSVTPHAVCGHSFGGKLALMFADQMCLPPSDVILLDPYPSIIEKTETDPVTETERILEYLGKHLDNPPTRRALVEQLCSPPFSISLPVAQWMATNIVYDGDHTAWAFDPRAIIQLYEAYKKQCCWNILHHPPPGSFVHFIRGEISERWKDEHLLKTLLDAQNDSMRVSSLPKSGHWMQTENPRGLENMITDILKNQK